MFLWRNMKKISLLFHLIPNTVNRVPDKRESIEDNSKIIFLIF